MTTGLTTVAMLALMLPNALFGCTWRHTHGHGTESPAAAEVASACDHDHGHEAPADPCGSPNGPHHEPDGCEATCEFVIAASVTPPPAGIYFATFGVADLAAAGRSVHFARADRPPQAAFSAAKPLSALCVWRL